MTDQTLRQQLLAALRSGGMSFHALSELLQIRHHGLEEELRHVERTVRAGGERLVVTPAECEACGFVFRRRSDRHLHPPGRCPRCRSERIADPIFRLEPHGG